MHESITLDRVLELAEDSMFGLGTHGICAKCGEETQGVEPDAEKYKCDFCGAFEVYGAELLMLLIA